MTQNDIKLAVIASNNALATNNPKGLTSALKNIGYKADSRFDILSYDELNKALLDIYNSDMEKWGQVVNSVSFNYEKTDSSTSPETKSIFDNIIKSLSTDNKATTETGKPYDWYHKATKLIIESKTETESNTKTEVASKGTPFWVYVIVGSIAIIILVLILDAFKNSNT